MFFHKAINFEISLGHSIPSGNYTNVWSHAPAMRPLLSIPQTRRTSANALATRLPITIRLVDRDNQNINTSTIHTSQSVVANNARGHFEHLCLLSGSIGGLVTHLHIYGDSSRVQSAAFIVTLHSHPYSVAMRR